MDKLKKAKELKHNVVQIAFKGIASDSVERNGDG
jgi:hypothetical protein